MKDITEQTATTENQVPQLCGDNRRRVVQLDAQIDIYLGREGDYRLLTAALDGENIVLFEAISGTERYPPGRNMHISLSAEEFDRLVVAVQQFRADQEQQQAEWNAEQGIPQSSDYDPFLDENNLP